MSLMDLPRSKLRSSRKRKPHTSAPRKFYAVQLSNFFLGHTLNGPSDHIGHWTAWYTVAVVDETTTHVEGAWCGQERRKMRVIPLDDHPWTYDAKRDGPQQRPGRIRGDE